MFLSSPLGRSVDGFCWDSVGSQLRNSALRDEVVAVTKSNCNEYQPTTLTYPWAQVPQPGNIIQIDEDVLWLRMPLPFALDHINLYLIRHEDGWVLVDTGLGDKRTVQLWDALIKDFLGAEPIKFIIITHFHYDHFGTADWLARKFDCSILMTRSEYLTLFYSSVSPQTENVDFERFFQRCGVSETDISGFFEFIAVGMKQPEIPRSFIRIEDGESIKLGGSDWQIIVGTGHSPEHACLYSKSKNIFISGDQVLPRITTNISVPVSEPDSNPLRDWLSSIEKLRAVPSHVLVLPAHEKPFKGITSRLNELKAHHYKILDEIVAFLQEGKDIQSITIHVNRELFSVFDKFLAVSETVAHVNYLWHKGTIKRRLVDERYIYTEA